MQSLKRLKQQVKEDTVGIHLITKVPRAINFIPIEIGRNPVALCEYKRLKYLDSSKLIDPLTNKYFYNACLLPDNRLFYRVGKEPKGYEDRIATCQLTDELTVVEGSNKYIGTYTNWTESTRTRILKSILPFVFKDGEHAEDPRAIIFNNHYYVFYTDGISIGVAKLDMDCNTIYSHYLFCPKNAEFKFKDGREKNWIPFLNGNKLFLLYSAEPVTYFECKDTERSLDMIVIHGREEKITWKFGYVRGGCPPAEYDSDSLLWCFHSTMKNDAGQLEYMFGVYVTDNTYPFNLRKFCKLPLLIGIASHASTALSLQHRVVYPCGLVKRGEGWRISMGVNDYEIAFLDVTENDFLW